MAKSFASTGVTTGTYADRLALSSPFVGMQFYQTDTDETLRYATDVDGANRWISMNNKNNRNIIINGAFNVWQRQTAFASGAQGTTAVTSSYYGPDRWQVLRTGVAAGATFQRISNPSIPGFAYALRMQRDSGNNLASAISASTSFETANVYRMQNQYVVLSFWARKGADFSATSSLMNVQVPIGTGTDGNVLTPFTSVSYPINTTVAVGTSWQKYVFVSSSSIGSATQLGLNLYYTPSTGAAGSNDWLEITGVQLESGTAPSDFDYIPFEVELMRCQRYYETSYSYGAYVVNSAGAGIAGSLEQSGYHTIIAAAGSTPLSIGFKVIKRVIPNMTFYGYNGTAGRYSYRDNGAENVGPVTFARSLAGSVGVLINSGNNWSAGSTLWIGFISSAEL